MFNLELNTLLKYHSIILVKQNPFQKFKNSHYFLLLRNIPLYDTTNWNCFQFETMMNKVAINIFVPKAIQELRKFTCHTSFLRKLSLWLCSSKINAEIKKE